MPEPWSIITHGNEVRATSTLKLGHDLVARVSTAEHVPGARALIEYLECLVTETDAEVASGEAVWYGFAAIRFELRGNVLTVCDAESGLLAGSGG